MTDTTEKDFIQVVKGLEDHYGCPPGNALLVWLLAILFDIDTDEAYDSISLQTQGDIHLDGIYIDDEKRTINIFEAKYAAPDVTLTHESLAKTCGQVVELKNKSFITKIKGVFSRQAFMELQDALNDKYAIKLYLVVFGALPAGSSDKLTTQLSEHGIKLMVFDKTAILNTFIESKTKDIPLPRNVKICLHAKELFFTDKDAIVATVCANDIAKLVKEYGYALFQQNVRSYLTLKNKINSRILNTLMASEKRKNFWYLNNGLSIVCSDLKPQEPSNNLILEEMQIVNGCQTAMTLAEADKKGCDLSEVELLVKIIKTNDHKLRENITESTNSQSVVKLRDFRANDPIQLRLQTEMANKGYFYIKKRGEVSPPGKELKGPIDMELAAQLTLAFRDKKASEAKSKKSQLFSKEAEGLYEQIFTKDLNPEYILLPWEIFKYITGKKSQYRKTKAQWIAQLIRIKTETPANHKDIEKLESILMESEHILHSDFHILALISYFIESNYGDLSAQTLEKLRISPSLLDLVPRLHTIASLHISKLVKEKRNQIDFTHSKFFKSSTAMKEILECSNDKINEWKEMEQKDFFAAFPFPKI